MSDTEQLVSLILTRYRRYFTASTVAEISEDLGWSASKTTQLYVKDL